MITIKRDTIIKPGDSIISTDKKEDWKVTKIEGYNFYLKEQSGRETVMTKFDLIIRPDLQLKLADERGYY